LAFDPTLAAIRYGTGLSPYHAPAGRVDDILIDLIAPDAMDRLHPIPGYDTIVPSLAAMHRGNRLLREARETPHEPAALAHNREIRVAANTARVNGHLALMARSLDSRYGLRERLASFWADHFTVKSRAFIQNHLVTPYVEDAIRPHITGRFQDMLKAVVLHPMMLTYLEQWRSTGPMSVLGLRLKRGLNENLARELLELHLLGVDGSYSQRDVRELAELLTGLVYHSRRGFYYDDRMAEPGAEKVLGVTFSHEASLRNILDALEVLAMHPETAAHLARKMAVHFVSPDPDAAMIAAMTQAYLDTGGNLLAMTAAMLQAPGAWIEEKTKVRLPMEFVTTSLRALGMTGAQAKSMQPRHYRRWVRAPLQVMGQPLQRPIGPDGWSEDAEDWIIPQAMAGRISWAMGAPAALLSGLPDPRDFARTALGDHVTPAVEFAAGAAESRREGIGVVLASAAFQRR